MWTRLVNECLDRTGRRLMAASLVLGVLAGLGVSQVLQVAPEFWANAGIWMLIGGTGAFFFDLLFISPIRLWREAESKLAQLRNSPPTGMRIERADQVIVMQGSIGSVAFAASSNTVIIGPDQEGVLFPRGTILRRDLQDFLRFSDSAVFKVVHADGSSDPPVLLDEPPQPPSSAVAVARRFGSAGIFCWFMAR